MDQSAVKDHGVLRINPKGIHASIIGYNLHAHTPALLSMLVHPMSSNRKSPIQQGCYSCQVEGKIVQVVACNKFFVLFSFWKQAPWTNE